MYLEIGHELHKSKSLLIHHCIISVVEISLLNNRRMKREVSAKNMFNFLPFLATCVTHLILLI